MDVATCGEIVEKDLNLTGKGVLVAMRSLSCLIVHLRKYQELYQKTFKSKYKYVLEEQFYINRVDIG